MKCLCFFVSVVVYLSVDTFVFSQDSTIYKQKSDSINTVQERKFWERESKKTNSIFFSVATGYSNIFPDKNLNDLWAHEASAGVILNNHWVFGLKFEFWNRTYRDYFVVNEETSFSGLGSFVSALYRFKIASNNLYMNCGIGFGEYALSQKTGSYHHTDSYMAMKLSAAFSYLIRPFFSIDLKLSYNALHAVNYGSKLKNIVNSKVGMTYYLFY